MCRTAEGKVHPERKKIKTAVHATFELLHRVETLRSAGYLETFEQQFRSYSI